MTKLRPTRSTLRAFCRSPCRLVAPGIAEASDGGADQKSTSAATALRRDLTQANGDCGGLMKAASSASFSRSATTSASRLDFMISTWVKRLESVFIVFAGLGPSSSANLVRLSSRRMRVAGGVDRRGEQQVGDARRQAQRGAERR